MLTGSSKQQNHDSYFCNSIEPPNSQYYSFA